MTKCLKMWEIFSFFTAQCMQILLWRSKITTSGLCLHILKLGFYNGKWIKSFSALKVLTQSTGYTLMDPKGRWAAYLSAVRAGGSVAPHFDRRPVNFMLYLGTLHILCLPCQTSFLPLIGWNEKYLTAAQISVISLWNRFRNGKTRGPAVTTCRSDIC